MKILFYLIAFVLYQSCFSQYKSWEKALITSRVTNIDLKIVQNSININYVNNKFEDSYSSFYSPANILAIRHAKYEYNYNLVNTAYSKIYYQEFINKTNNYIIEDWKVKINEYVNTLNNIDWSQQSNYALQVRNYILSIYNINSIKDELILLKEINNEILRLKSTYPGTFHKTDRYVEINLALGELKNCSPSQINEISYKYGFF